MPGAPGAHGVLRIGGSTCCAAPTAKRAANILLMPVRRDGIDDSDRKSFHRCSACARSLLLTSGVFGLTGEEPRALPVLLGSHLTRDGRLSLSFPFGPSTAYSPPAEGAPPPRAARMGWGYAVASYPRSSHPRRPARGWQQGLPGRKMARHSEAWSDRRGRGPS